MDSSTGFNNDSVAKLLLFCHECFENISTTDLYGTCYRCGAAFCQDCHKCACCQNCHADTCDVCPLVNG